jgi:hypothetical protein
MLPVISLHATSRATKMAGVGAHRRERPSPKLDPPWRPRQVQTKPTSTPVQSRHIYARRYTGPTRVSRLGAPTFRSLRSVGTLTQPTLCFPYVCGTQAPNKTNFTATKDSNKIQSTTDPNKYTRNGSVARMSNAGRLRSGPSLPMSDRLVITWPVGRRAPITSPHLSLAHPGQWIRRHIKRYTLQGAAFTNLNYSVHMKESAPPASQTPRVLHSVLRHLSESDRLQKNSPHGDGAPPRAPPSVRTSIPDARKKQTHAPSDLGMCRQQTLTTSTPHPTHIHFINTSYIADYPSTPMSLPSNLPDSYKQVLLRDRPTPLFADDHFNPRSRLVGHPLAPFLTAPQIPNADHGLGSPLAPTPGTRLQTPLVLTAPSSAYDLGRAVDPSARVIDSYLLTCQYSTAPLTLPTSGSTVCSSPTHRIHRTLSSPSALSLGASYSKKFMP